MIDYTLVLGVDAKHLEQLALVLLTWVKHKPSLLKRDIIVFYDRDQLNESLIHEAITGTIMDLYTTLNLVPWPPPGVTYPVGSSKWDDQQRYKMLAGFVHVPAIHVRTSYWLKLDVDTVATGCDDWIDPEWFKEWPAIVSQRWGYTKPANQMDLLDEWASKAEEMGHRFGMPPLCLHPRPGASSLPHKRIISWCAFFNTVATKCAAMIAETTCGTGKLPVPSQDGYIWYHSMRQGWPIVRTQMKSRGWLHRSNLRNIQEAVKKALV